MKIQPQPPPPKSELELTTILTRRTYVWRVFRATFVRLRAPACTFVRPSCTFVRPSCTFVHLRATFVRPSCTFVRPSCDLRAPSCTFVHLRAPSCGVGGCFFAQKLSEILFLESFSPKVPKTESTGTVRCLGSLRLESGPLRFGEISARIWGVCARIWILGEMLVCLGA